jgi:hypothetical protein
MGLLNWLESTGFSTWVREGESILAFPTILTLHTFGLGLLVGASLVVNLRLLGIGQSLALAPLRPLFSVMWVGFMLNLVTGTMLFAAQATERGASVLFLVKMLFVVLGVVTTVLIRNRVFDAPSGADRSSSPRLLAVLSLVAWTAAITSGRLLAYV